MGVITVIICASLIVNTGAVSSKDYQLAYLACQVGRSSILEMGEEIGCKLIVMQRFPVVSGLRLPLLLDRTTSFMHSLSLIKTFTPGNICVGGMIDTFWPHPK